MRRLIRLAFLDFDGVIWKSEYEMYQSMVDVFTILRPGFPIPSFPEFWQTISAPYEDWYRAHGFTEPYDVIVEAHNRHHRIETALPNPEAITFLRELHTLGIPMYIVSASPAPRLMRMLEREHLTTLFMDVHGDGEHTKDAYMRRIVQERGLDPRQAMMIGDRPSDVRDGRNAGVVTVAYTGGHPTEELLGRAAPDHLVTRLHDLLPFFADERSRISQKG